MIFLHLSVALRTIRVIKNKIDETRLVLALVGGRVTWSEAIVVAVVVDTGDFDDRNTGFCSVPK